MPDEGPDLIPVKPLVAILVLAAAPVLAAPAPTFEAFPVEEVWSGQPAAVDNDATKDWRPNRSNLRRAQAAGPNFAGRFTLAQWNCGLRCTQVVLLDTATGKPVGDLRAATGVRFRRDSELLIANPPESIPAGDKRTKTKYYRFTAGAFTEIEVSAP